MPYKRKSAYKKRPYRKRGRGALAKRNAKKIRQLEKNQYKKCQYYHDNLTDDMQNVDVFQIVNPKEWTPLFASNNNNEIGDRFFIDYIKLQFNLTVMNSGTLTVNPFHYSIFVVSLSKQYAKSTYNRTQAMTQLTTEVDYHSTSLGATVGQAQWTLNPLLYRVHARRKGMVGDFADQGSWGLPEPAINAQQITNISDGNKNHVINMKWRRQLKRGVGNWQTNKTDWKDMMLSDVEAHDQLFVISFNNASDLQEIAQHASATIYGKEPI